MIYKVEGGEGPICRDCAGVIEEDDDHVEYDGTDPTDSYECAMCGLIIDPDDEE